MYQISHANLLKGLKKINLSYPIVIPIVTDQKYILKYFSKGSWDENLWSYAPIRTPQPLKCYYYPPTQKVAEYPIEKNPSDQFVPLAIIGSKACDVHALQIIDKVFAEGDFPDPYYTKARRNHILITTDCLEAGEYCYCTLMNCQPYPIKEFALNISKLIEKYIIEVGSYRGKEILENYFENYNAATPAQIKSRDNNRKELEEKVKKQNEEFKYYRSHRESIEKHLNSPEWADLCKTCVECGICTQICPTCHCFLLFDHAVEDKYERIKVWDSCFFAGYSRMAGGLTPRLSLAERFKHRFYHKFDSFVTNFAVEACTGCGRCVEGCMGKIDLRKVLSELERRVVLKEKPELI